MPNHPQMSKLFELSSDCAIFSGHTLRISPSSQHPSSSLHARTPATKEVHYQRKPWQLSRHYKMRSLQNLSWRSRADRQYALITDAATGTADTPGGLGAILTQKDKYENYYAISYASRQLKDHEKNYSPFLLESAAAVWGMDVFNEYLKGKQFILFTDHKPLEKMGHLHTKTMNRL